MDTRVVQDDVMEWKMGMKKVKHRGIGYIYRRRRMYWWKGSDDYDEIKSLYDLSPSQRFFGEWCTAWYCDRTYHADCGNGMIRAYNNCAFIPDAPVWTSHEYFKSQNP